MFSSAIFTNNTKKNKETRSTRFNLGLQLSYTIAPRNRKLHRQLRLLLTNWERRVLLAPRTWAKAPSLVLVSFRHFYTRRLKELLGSLMAWLRQILFKKRFRFGTKSLKRSDPSAHSITFLKGLAYLEASLNVHNSTWYTALTTIEKLLPQQGMDFQVDIHMVLALTTID